GCSSSASLNARYLPAAAAGTMAGGPVAAAAVMMAGAPVAAAEWNADFRILSSESDGGGAGNAANAPTLAATRDCSPCGSRFPNQEVVDGGKAVINGADAIGAFGGDVDGNGGVAAVLPVAAVPHAVWHRVHLRAVQVPVEGDVAAKAATSAPGGIATGGMPAPVSLLPPPPPPPQQQQQTERQQSMLLVITQFDVTAEVTAQRETAGLLQEEHKVLESIFPRHCIEYLTLRGGAGRRRGPARTGPWNRGPRGHGT
ncbi:hypothetical protein VaNZ11_011835, partial [Volvox africanus]